MTNAIHRFTATELEGIPRLALIGTAQILPTEEHDPAHAAALAQQIAALQLWTVPVLVLQEAPVLLDGHHRLAAARRLGLLRVPAYLLAKDDPRLSLRGWRPGEAPTMADVLAHATRGTLFPPKTTRFEVAVPRPETQIPLTLLRAPAAP